MHETDSKDDYGSFSIKRSYQSTDNMLGSSNPAYPLNVALSLGFQAQNNKLLRLPTKYGFVATSNLAGTKGLIFLW